MTDPDDIVWIPAVPLPLFGLFTDYCSCGRKFRSFDRAKRRDAYELHWRREHEKDAVHDFGSVTVAVTRWEADQIYARVYAP